MKHEAEEHKEEDEKKKELISQRNQAEQLAFTAEEAVEENKESIDDDVAEEITADIKNVREKMKSDDLEVIKEATEKLGKSMQQIGEAVQKQAEAKQAEQKKEGNVRDAEVDNDSDAGDESEE
jgi:molecular chaperone DnaK